MLNVCIGSRYDLGLVVALHCELFWSGNALHFAAWGLKRRIITAAGSDAHHTQTSES